jgi:TPR repeat protein
MIRVWLLVRQSCLPSIFGLALFLQALAPHASLAADREDGKKASLAFAQSLRAIALKLYPVDDIIAADQTGDYDLPEGASLASARAARALLQLGALSGDATDHELLGIMFESGAGGMRDYILARQHYRFSGDRVALWHLGLLVAAGKGGPVDLPAARTIFKRASDLGLIDASYEYAHMVELGLGGPRDEVEARRIYESTLEYCHGDIANRLAVMLMRGVGGPANAARSAEMHLKAVECHNRFYEDPMIVSAPNLIDPQTMAEIQRLLKKRGSYRGPITGRVDEATRAALDHSWGV